MRKIWRTSCKREMSKGRRRMVKCRERNRQRICKRTRCSDSCKIRIKRRCRRVRGKKNNRKKRRVSSCRPTSCSRKMSSRTGR